MNSHKAKIKKLEDLIPECSSEVLILFIKIGKIFYCFGNVTEKTKDCYMNFKKAIEFDSQGKFPDLKFISFVTLENHYRELFPERELIFKDVNVYFEKINEILNKYDSSGYHNPV